MMWSLGCVVNLMARFTIDDLVLVAVLTVLMPLAAMGNPPGGGMQLLGVEEGGSAPPKVEGTRGGTARPAATAPRVPLTAAEFLQNLPKVKPQFVEVYVSSGLRQLGLISGSEYAKAIEGLTERVANSMGRNAGTAKEKTTNTANNEARLSSVLKGVRDGGDTGEAMRVLREGQARAFQNITNLSTGDWWRVTTEIDQILASKNPAAEAKSLGYRAAYSTEIANGNSRGVVFTKAIGETGTTLAIRLDPDGHPTAGEGPGAWNRAASHANIELVPSKLVDARGQYPSTSPNIVKLDRTGTLATTSQAAHVPLAAQQVMEIGTANWVNPGELPPPPQAPPGPVDLNDPAWKLFEESMKQYRAEQAARSGLKAGAPQAGAPVAEAPPAEGIRGPAGQPGFGQIAADTAKAGGIAVVSTVVSKVVTRETGSSTAGGVAGLSLAAGATYLMFGAEAFPPAAVAIAATAGGKYAGQAITGTEAGGTAGSMAAAGAVGAWFGGPIGAGGAVLIVGAVDLTDAWIDQYYASVDGKKIDHRLHTIWVGNAYGEILGRLPDENGLKFHVHAADDGGSLDDLRHRVAHSPEAQGLITKVFQHHAGRDASAAERQAWTSALGRAGVSMRNLEMALATSPEAGERRAVTAQPN